MLAAGHTEGFNFEKAKFPSLPGYFPDLFQVANAMPILPYSGAALSLDITSRQSLPPRGSPASIGRTTGCQSNWIWLPVMKSAVMKLSAGPDGDGTKGVPEALLR